MKTSKKIILIFISAIIFSITGNAQQLNEIKLNINKGSNGKIFSINDKGEKTISFKISGLSDQNDIDQFVTKVKEIKGVLDFVISSDNNTDFREGSAVFLSTATKYYFKNVLIEAGVSKIIIDNEEISPKDLNTESKKR